MSTSSTLAPRQAERAGDLIRDDKPGDGCCRKDLPVRVTAAGYWFNSGRAAGYGRLPWDCNAALSNVFAQANIHPAIATMAEIALSPRASASSRDASSAGRTFDSRRPSNRCMSGPRSMVVQILTDTISRSADESAKIRAASGIGGFLRGSATGAGVNSRRQCGSQIRCLRFRGQGLKAVTAGKFVMDQSSLSADRILG